MTGDLRALLGAAAIGGYALFAVLAMRSSHEADRVAEQWGSDASAHWMWGKRLLTIGIIGVFVFLQQLVSLPMELRAIGFFASLACLCYGERRIGSGFRDVADAQDNWHRRNFGGQ